MLFFFGEAVDPVQDLRVVHEILRVIRAD
jgi:hypothetical protein